MSFVSPFLAGVAEQYLTTPSCNAYDAEPYRCRVPAAVHRLHIIVEISPRCPEAVICSPLPSGLSNTYCGDCLNDLKRSHECLLKTKKPAMNRIQQWVAWIRDNPDMMIDVIRVYLGIGLMVRGFLFISHADGIAALVDLSEFSLASAALAHYVTFAHLIGGALLAAGLFTRFAALIQIPVLVGAVSLVHFQEGLLTAGQSLEFSALVLFLLAVVLVVGAGRLSADYYVFVQDHEEAASRPDILSPERIKERIKERAAAEVDTAPAAMATSAPRECSCGNDITHPRVVAEPRYSIWAGFYFMLGISAPVREVVFYCQECGTIMKRTKDAEMLRQYRWHTG